MTFTGSFHNGKMDWSDPEAIIAFARKMDGERLVVNIEKWHARRTDEQNRFYWGGCIGTIAKHSDFDGWDPEDIHEWLKQELLMREFGGHKFPESTAKMTTKRMAEYLDRVIRFAAERGIYIEDPYRK